MNIFIKRVLLFSFMLFFFLFIAEIGMRLTGHKPGKIVYSPWNKEVEQLSKRNGFIADSNGIFRVDPIAIHWIDSVIQVHKNDRNYKDDRNIADSLVYEIYSLGYESLNVIHAKVSNPLTEFYQNIKTDNSGNDLYQAVKNYVEHPVNGEGFRSIAFGQYHSAKKKVLLIGDSFTWGHSATDITNSFPDILLAKGYAVYNTGVSGGDVAQYTAIAEKYIVLLKPDVVIVNFYLGNDVMYFDRKVEPFKPIFYATNAGNLISCPYTTYFKDDSEAYHFMLRMSYLSNDTIFKKFCSQTAIGTLVWMDLKKFSFAWDCPQEYKKYYERELAREQKEPTANALMKRIETICEENNSRFVLAVIPESKEGRLTKVSEYKNLFPQQNYFYPASLTTDDYRKDDGHFNDEGQKTYAKFLLQFLEKHN
jgi:lysophospholipase L1-like esterase